MDVWTQVTRFGLFEDERAASRKHSRIGRGIRYIQQTTLSSHILPDSKHGRNIGPVHLSKRQEVLGLDAMTGQNLIPSCLRYLPVKGGARGVMELGHGGDEGTFRDGSRGGAAGLPVPAAPKRQQEGQHQRPKRCRCEVHGVKVAPEQKVGQGTMTLRVALPAGRGVVFRSGRDGST